MILFRFARVISLQNVFSSYRMCSLAIECVLQLQNVSFNYRTCSLTTECVLQLQNVFSSYRMCSLATECVLQLQNVFCGCRMCSLTADTCRRALSYMICAFRWSRWVQAVGFAGFSSEAVYVSTYVYQKKKQKKKQRMHRSLDTAGFRQQGLGRRVQAGGFSSEAVYVSTYVCVLCSAGTDKKIKIKNKK